MKQKYNVTGMSCSACSANIEKNVRKLDGVKTVSVNLLQNSMLVEYDNSITNDNLIINAVINSGYGASIKNNTNHKSNSDNNTVEKETLEDDIKLMKKRLIISFAFLIPLMYISMGSMFGAKLPIILTGHENMLIFSLTQLFLTLPIMYVNRKYFQIGFKSLIKGSPNMDSLIAIGSSAAAIYSIYAVFNMSYYIGHSNFEMAHKYMMDLYFESAGMILTLITMGKYLETRSKGKTSDAITKLINLAPKTAVILKEGVEREVPVEDVVVGDVVIVKSGQSIPVDGIIIEGSTAIDESALTGESIPVEKNVDDNVIAATINKSGYFKFRATKVGNNTTLAQIVQLVEDAAGSKAPIAKLADKVSGIFVPIVIVIAVVSSIVWLLVGQSFAFALSIGIAVLVISCPCALGLATPTAIMVGTGKGAENGILIKSAESLEIAHEIDTVVLDKTGTVTEGKPKVTDIYLNEGIFENRLLRIAASIEKASEHPLAEAIVEYVINKNIDLLQIDNFRAIAGEGIYCDIDNKKVIAGNLKMMIKNDININDMDKKGEELSNAGKTPLYFAQDNKLLGIIAVADTIKETSIIAVNEFEAMGIDVIMLTGDNKKTAEAIRKQVNIKTVISEVLPQDKENEIRKLQERGKKVAMIGDGINDAPALARANVGIAIGAGTDIAIESADIVLMKSQLTDAVSAIQLSKAVIKNIKENLFWAFFYNCIGIPLAAGVFYTSLNWKLNPMFGAAAMSLSSVFVVSNALRLRFFKPNFKKEIPINIKPNTEDISDKKESIVMKKTIVIEGMTCNHCTGRVSKALNSIDGIEAEVNLEDKTAYCNLSKDISDEELVKVITNAGYKVIDIK